VATAKLLLLMMQLLVLVWLLGWTGIGRGTLMLLLLLTGSTTVVFGLRTMEDDYRDSKFFL
jgi:hypothetical protein